jgi:thiamine-monophosphate kinase
VNEFELIRRFFASQPVHRADVIAGIGDDAAIVRVPKDRELVVTTDTLVSGVHFFPDADAATLGHKVLAVNLSDLAAMGADPAWFTLSLTLPAPDTAWLDAFCAGLYALAREYDVQLIGGNTARGPLSLTVEAHGFVPPGAALRRGGARAGDAIYVTGTLGDAGMALAQRLQRIALLPAETAEVTRRLDRPSPRVRAGVAARGIASAAIDISDGLMADLGHLAEASGVGARIGLESLPLSPAYRAHRERLGWDVALTAGEDYELCFTVPPERVSALERAVAAFDCTVTRIGDITEQPGVRVLDARGARHRVAAAGYDHFQNS